MSFGKRHWPKSEPLILVSELLAYANEFFIGLLEKLFFGHVRVAEPLIRPVAAGLDSVPRMQPLKRKKKKDFARKK